MSSITSDIRCRIGDVGKACSRCKRWKRLVRFNYCKTGRLERHNHCRSCQRSIRRRWYLKHREREIDKANAYSKSAKAVAARRRRYVRHRDRILKINRVLRRTPKARALARIARNRLYYSNPSFRLAVNLRTRMRRALKGIAKSSRTLALLGCSVERLRKYLQARFRRGMSWKNYGYRGWHIDHVVPCDAFDLRYKRQQAKCFHYKNLRPEWRFENQSKGSKLLRRWRA